MIATYAMILFSVVIALVGLVVDQRADDEQEPVEVQQQYESEEGERCSR